MQKSMQEYLDVLNPEQKAAVIHENNPLLILAGAGSGKTRVITTKIAYLINQKNVNPSSILSVTFTKKAANEMRERAIAIEPESSFAQIRTFHSFGSWFLRQYSDTIGVEPNFTVYDDDDMAVLIRKAVPSLSVKEANIAAKQIALAKDYCLFPEDDLSCIHSDFDLNEIYSAYQKRLAATGNVDFGDLIMLPVKVLQENPNVARYIHNRFKVIMVDEYQDSNIAQYRLLQEISGVKEKNDSYVCVVGDDDQSIYHFRGAEVQNILTFPEKFPNTDIIKLETNYRSTSKILQTASLVVKNNVDRLGKNLISARGDGKMPVLAFLPDQEGEVRFVSEVIRKSVEKGDSYSDWAILYRTNAQSLGFEKEFIHKKIPYVVVGSLKFYQREEIKDALAYLSLCANPKDEISFRRIINKPSRGIGEKTQDKILETAIRYQEDEEGQIQIVYEDLVQTAQNIASSFAKSSPFFSSLASKRTFSRRTASPFLRAATFACASAPMISSANVTLPSRYSLRRAATGASVSVFLSFLSAFARSSALTASLSSSGSASTFFFSFLVRPKPSVRILWGLPICEQRTTRAPLLSKYLIVGSASTILLSLVITPSLRGTLKSHLTRTLLPATSTSSIVFLL